jgi:hypothetical protein
VAGAAGGGGGRTVQCCYDARSSHKAAIFNSDVSVGLLDCDTACTSRQVMAFQRNVLSPLSAVTGRSEPIRSVIVWSGTLLRP